LGFVMLEIEVVKTLSNNYLLCREGTCLVFDCGGAKVASRVEELGLKPLAVFITHLHFDHVAGLRSFTKRFKEVRVYSPRTSLADLLDINTAIGRLLTRGVLQVGIEGGESFELGPFEVEVIKVGRHTRHHVCYLVYGEALVTGDVAAIRGGRVIIMSKKVETLLREREVKAVLPGHSKYLVR